MINLKNNEAGFSGIEIILVLAVLVLLGTVGWLFYNNYSKAPMTSVTTTKSKSSAKPSTSISSDKYVGWTRYCSKLVNACIKYPPGWNNYVCSNNPPGNTSGVCPPNDFNIVSSDKAVTVGFDFQPTSLQATPGTCNPHTNDSITTYFETTKLPNASNLYLVNSGTKTNAPGGYIYDLGLTTGQSNGQPPVVGQSNDCPPTSGFNFKSKDGQNWVNVNYSGYEHEPKADLDTAKLLMLSFQYQS
jgi:hypothetical protein